MKDFLSDMLTRIKNSQRAGLDAVVMPPHMPKICLKLLEILYHEGYIRGFSEIYDTKKNVKQIKVFLKYNTEGGPIFQDIFRISKPGRRIYISTKVLWKPKSNSGLFIFSTPQGVMTDREARLLNLGGEVLFGIY